MLEFETWARTVAGLDIFGVREEHSRLSDDVDALLTEADRLIRQIRDEKISRGTAKAIMARTGALRDEIRREIWRAYKKKRTALLNLEELLVAEEVEKLDEPKALRALLDTEQARA
jgi:hypothetical protein